MHFNSLTIRRSERTEFMNGVHIKWIINNFPKAAAILSCIIIVFLIFAGSSDAAVFGSQLFTGKFKDEQMSGFNPNYQIAIGDKVTVRIWGAITYEGALVVDPQGNIFIPNVGPVNIIGARNADLSAIVEKGVQKVYKSNTGVYASLEAVQPVKVFVTGFVKNPGLYGGLSSNSVLYFIDKAGGVDSLSGSFRDITVLRGEKVRTKINLYDFLLQGKLELVQFADGDVIFVGPVKNTISVIGKVTNPYDFEIPEKQAPLKEVLAYAQPKPDATYVSIARTQGTEKMNEYYPIEKAGDVTIYNGDVVSVYPDRYPGTILVRVEGAHSSEHAIVLPYGVKMQEAIKRIIPNSLSNIESVQLFRKSVAIRQKEMINSSLQVLQSQALTATSSTIEEVSLRAKEAEMINKFVEIASKVEPKGQIILGSLRIAENTLLEDGDIIRIPEISSLVMVHGEVLFPNAISFRNGFAVDDYIQLSGGFTQTANKKVLVLRQNGVIEEDSSAVIKPGDEIMVLPKVETKRLEITRAITQILYQIAIAARMVLTAP